MYVPDLKYNTDDLMQAADEYVLLADDLERIKEELQRSIEEMQSRYWISDGGDAFMELYENSWADTVMRYASVLRELSIMLNKAASGYMDATFKINEIPNVHIF